LANPSHLLVVEDEGNVGLTLVERLSKEGYRVDWAKSVVDANRLLKTDRFDLALLDVGLPDGNGFEVAKDLRRLQGKCAIVFLTAHGDPEDRVRGLELGAEDYVVKPFHFRELLLRIGNGLKRVNYIENLRDGEAAEVVLGEAKVRFSRFEAERDGKTFTLTHKECAVLKFLFERRGQVVSRDEILDFAWGTGEYPTPRTVDNFVLRLRRLLERDPENPELIASIRGVGYKMIH